MRSYKWQDGKYIEMPYDVATLMLKLRLATIWETRPGILVIKYNGGATLPALSA